MVTRKNPMMPPTKRSNVVDYACLTFSESAHDADECKHCGWDEDAHIDRMLAERTKARLEQTVVPPILAWPAALVVSFWRLITGKR